jgi:hypothetical protein
MELFVVSIIAAAVMIFFLLKAHEYKQTERLLDRVIEELIEPAREKLNDGNRFLVSEEILLDAFPEYEQRIVKEVWQCLKRSPHLEQDPYDSEWRVRKR